MRRKPLRRIYQLEALERRLLLTSLPEAVADQYPALDGQTLIVPAPGVLANDSDADFDPLTAELVSDVSHGTLTLNEDGSFEYVPRIGFFGTDSFTYRAVALDPSVEFTVDRANSAVTVDGTVTIPNAGSDSDSDTSSITGTVVARVTPDMEPFSETHITDMDVVVADGAALNFVFRVFGIPVAGFDAELPADPSPDPELTPLRLQMVTPGPATAVSGGNFIQANNQLRGTGTARLDGTGLADGVIPEGAQEFDLPAVIDLEGTVDQQGGDVVLTFPIRFQQTINENGATVDLDVQGTVVARGPVNQDIEVSQEVTVTIEVLPHITAADDLYATGEDVALVAAANFNPLQELVLPAGSVWRYLDDSAGEGSDWPTAAYNDDFWLEGPAQFGYGDGDEATELYYGGNDNNKTITSYFRRQLFVEDLAGVSALQIDLLRDDGAAIYLNGVEIVRDNLPPDAGATTLASSTVSGDDETTFFRHTIALTDLPPGTLLAGHNLLAAEVHQAAPTSSDVSFDLELHLLRGMGGVLDNDVDHQSHPMRSVLLTQPVHGSLTFQDNGGLFYTPAPDFHGEDGFDYIALDSDAQLLVSPQATWQYLDDGSDQGTAWQAPGYDDSGWSVGSAPLGYGEGDETTLVDFGPDEGNKHITSYFRHAFEVSDPAQFNSLILEVVRDDGVAVYLNGQELGRDNLEPAAGFDQPATTAIGGTDERTPVRFQVPSSMLQAGENILAAEIHQSAGNSSDIRFQAWLADQASSQARATIRVAASDDPPIAEPDLYSGSDGQPLSIPADQGLLANDLDAEGDPLEVLLLQAPASGDLQVNSDGSFEFLPAGPGVQQATYQVRQQTPTNLIDWGDAWRYLDDGSDQGTAWRQRVFADSNWAVGNGELGYGDGDETTVIRYGASSGNKHVTTYFRKTFQLADATALVEDLTLEVIRDDGVAIYLNGVEVGRQNLASNAAFDSFAEGSIGGVDEQTPVLFTVPASLLRSGTNTLAVEMHQATGSSSDLSFDLRLQGHLYSQPTTVEFDVQPTDSTPPSVTQFDINMGLTDPPDLPSGGQFTSWHQQRSDLRNLVLHFSEPIQAEVADLTLTNLGLNAPADADQPFLLLERHLSVAGSELTLTFAADELPPGVYRLEVGAGVTDAAGNPLDGDGDGTGGDPYLVQGNATNNFYRLLSDWNGDQGASVFDFPAFSYWFGQQAPAVAPEYVDLNRDGGVSIFDFPLFAESFGTSVVFPQAAQPRGWTVLPPRPADPLPDAHVLNAQELKARQLDGQAPDARRLDLPTRLDHRLAAPQLAARSVHRLFQQWGVARPRTQPFTEDV